MGEVFDEACLPLDWDIRQIREQQEEKDRDLARVVVDRDRIQDRASLYESWYTVLNRENDLLLTELDAAKAETAQLKFGWDREAADRIGLDEELEGLRVQNERLKRVLRLYQQSDQLVQETREE